MRRNETCPVEAISKGENGLTAIDAEECTGCGQCVEACPFDAIIMLSEDVAAKCDGCADEIVRGWNPTCVRACPMRALRYGAVDDDLLEKRSEDTDFNDHNIGPLCYICLENALPGARTGSADILSALFSHPYAVKMTALPAGCIFIIMGEHSSWRLLRK